MSSGVWGGVVLRERGVGEHGSEYDVGESPFQRSERLVARRTGIGSSGEKSDCVWVRSGLGECDLEDRGVECRLPVRLIGIPA